MPVEVECTWAGVPSHRVKVGVEVAQVHDAESLFNAYWQLCQRYIAHAKPRRPFEPV